MVQHVNTGSAATVVHQPNAQMEIGDLPPPVVCHATFLKLLHQPVEAVLSRLLPV